MTYDQAHWEMWNYVVGRLRAIAMGTDPIPDQTEIEDPGAFIADLRESWPGITGFNSVPYACFACMYAERQSRPKTLDCSKCPIDWNKQSAKCRSPRCPTKQLELKLEEGWDNLQIWREAVELAEKVREITWKPGCVDVEIQEDE